MSRVMHLTSLANPRVKQVVRLREQRHRRKTGLFIAEGLRELSRAVQARLQIRQLFRSDELLDETARNQLNELGIQQEHAVEHYTVTGQVFRKMAYLREPEGVLAVVEQPVWSFDTLPAVTVDTCYLVAVGSEKPGNLGAMVRTAEAAGCDAVLAAGSPVDAFNPNAIRTSTCAVFNLPVISASEDQVRQHLVQYGLRIMAATLAGSVLHTQADWQGPIAITIGPEDVGLDEPWLNAADTSAGQRVRIPMRGRLVDSLNASNAAAILLFEALRQRDVQS